MTRILLIDDAGIGAITAAITAGATDAELLELLASKALDATKGLMTAESFTEKEDPMRTSWFSAISAAMMGLSGLALASAPLAATSVM